MYVCTLCTCSVGRNQSIWNMAEEDSPSLCAHVHTRIVGRTSARPVCWQISPGTEYGKRGGPPEILCGVNLMAVASNIYFFFPFPSVWLCHWPSIQMAPNFSPHSRSGPNIALTYMACPSITHTPHRTKSAVATIPNKPQVSPDNRYRQFFSRQKMLARSTSQHCVLLPDLHMLAGGGGISIASSLDHRHKW